MEIYRLFKKSDEISEGLHELNFLLTEEISRLKDERSD